MALSNEQMDAILHQIRQRPGLSENLPAQESAIVRDALDGRNIYEIAQRHRVSEAAAWSILSGAAQLATGGPAHAQPESGGLGSDTDPGVTGGYGNTGFGSLGNEPPFPTPDEPDEQI
jgi:hypothetical protein